MAFFGAMVDKLNVFVSYSQTDTAFANRLSSDLRIQGCQVWLDQWEIYPGDRIIEKIEEGLSRSEVFLLILSPDSVSSPWVGYEREAWLAMQIADEKSAKLEGRVPKRTLIPILYRDCAKPSFLEALKHVRINDQDYDSGLKGLVAALERIPRRRQWRRDEKLDPGIPLRKLILNLLKSLLSSQFDEVVFVYNMPASHLPSHLAQVQKAILLIQFAEQREGEKMPELVKAVYEVAPHLKQIAAES